ncbi:hypothetical protein VKT23_005700 [Stygiomarasmius scandens]|uniref:Uncharacterized protein n=1 Tax=Marasmiellus scandens TaxID=2682957 RepID=A0ABR1JSD5_9AGAR
MDAPHYVLFSSHSSSSAALGHPAIQYRYADDSPISLLPRHPDEHVLLLNYDPSSPSSLSGVSTSAKVVVTGVKIEEAPGAAAQEERHNDRMYIIETISNPECSTQNLEYQSPQNVLAQFKQRNALLRRALAYPGAPHAASPT